MENFKSLPGSIVQARPHGSPVCVVSGTFPRCIHSICHRNASSSGHMEQWPLQPQLQVSPDFNAV